MIGELKTYKGSCHCGAVQFEATTDLTGLSDCNCSRCSRLSWVMQPVPADAFALVSGEDRLKTYRFNTERIEHQFCTECGIESFARGKDGDGADVYVINVNCLTDVPAFDRAAIKHWDGAAF